MLGCYYSWLSMSAMAIFTNYLIAFLVADHSDVGGWTKAFLVTYGWASG